MESIIQILRILINMSNKTYLLLEQHKNTNKKKNQSLKKNFDSKMLNSIPLHQHINMSIKNGIVRDLTLRCLHVSTSYKQIHQMY